MQPLAGEQARQQGADLDALKLDRVNLTSILGPLGPKSAPVPVGGQLVDVNGPFQTCQGDDDAGKRIGKRRS